MQNTWHIWLMVSATTTTIQTSMTGTFIHKGWENHLKAEIQRMSCEFAFIVQLWAQHWPWTARISHTICFMTALFTKLCQVELGLQGHLQSTSVDHLQLHPQACRRTRQQSQHQTTKIKTKFKHGLKSGHTLLTAQIKVLMCRDYRAMKSNLP